ncbi:hypothetical protein Holit_00111 [Hollandina sp. SP2]
MIAQTEGATVIYLAWEKRVIGFIVLADTLRPDATHTIKTIQNTKTKTVLLTGNAAQAAEQDYRNTASYSIVKTDHTNHRG